MAWRVAGSVWNRNAADPASSGFGYGDFIRLRDEFGNIWRGSAEEGPDESVRYRFRDALGRTVTGVSDSFGLVLRDERGKTWRGFVE